MTIFRSSEDEIRDELLKKSQEASKNATEVVYTEIKSNEDNSLNLGNENDVHSLAHFVQSGINVQNGIDILGSKEFYIEKLKQFQVELKSAFGKLIEYKASMNMKDYSLETNNLKISSNYLGFDKLYELSKVHSIKSLNNDFNFVAENFKEYEDEIDKSTKLINEYFG